MNQWLNSRCTFWSSEKKLRSSWLNSWLSESWRNWIQDWYIWDLWRYQFRVIWILQMTKKFSQPRWVDPSCPKSWPVDVESDEPSQPQERARAESAKHVVFWHFLLYMQLSSLLASLLLWYQRLGLCRKISQRAVEVHGDLPKANRFRDGMEDYYIYRLQRTEFDMPTFEIRDAEFQWIYLRLIYDKSKRK